MNGSRRRLLAASSSIAASFAGCLGRVTDDSASASETTGDERSPRTADATTVARNYPSTVEVTTTVERDEITYVPENDTVRYVAAYGSKDPGGDDETPPEREPIYEHIPFDEWAETECASVGSKRVYEAMTERLDGETEGVSAGITRDSGGLAVLVVHQTMFDRDGGLVSEPAVSFERVKRVAPERVEVSLTLSERTHSCTVPVTTREEEVHQD